MKALMFLIVTLLVTTGCETIRVNTSFNDDGTTTTDVEKKRTGLLDSTTYQESTRVPDTDLDPDELIDRQATHFVTGQGTQRRIVKGPGPATPAAILLHGLMMGIGSANADGATSSSSAVSNANNSITVP